jgi:ribosomal protein S6--L-glutamate ligase
MPSALRQSLELHGRTVELVVVDDGEPLDPLSPLDLPSPSPLAGLEPGDVVVARTRDPFGLALLAQAEARGARAYDSSAAIEGVRDKIRGTLALEQAGVPVPETFIVRRPAHLRSLPAYVFPLLLKPRDGDNANGLRLIRDPGELASLEWSQHVVLAQRYVEVGHVDVKVYVADEHIWAVRRPSPLTGRSGPVTRVPVTSEHEELATACQGIFDLRLLGIDVLESSGGPLVVDVNEFPNYSGIEEAPEVIGGLVAAEADAADAVTADSE